MKFLTKQNNLKQVAGSVLAAYIGFGVPASQLLTASIMAAPIGLAISKIIHPETRHTKANWETIRNFPKG
jgi:pyrimidine nucleoside transport protein